MNATHILILIGTAAFATTCLMVKLLRAFILHEDELHQTISDGLTGPYHRVEDAGFIALGGALAILGVILASPISWLCWLVAVGILGAMASDTYRPFLMRHFGGTAAKWRERHLIFAGIAFVGALALEASLAHGWLLWALVAAYPISVGIVRWIWPKYTAWQEWVAALAIVAFLLAWSIK